MVTPLPSISPRRRLSCRPRRPLCRHCQSAVAPLSAVCRLRVQTAVSRVCIRTFLLRLAGGVTGAGFPIITTPESIDSSELSRFSTRFFFRLERSGDLRGSYGIGAAWLVVVGRCCTDRGWCATITVTPSALGEASRFSRATGLTMTGASEPVGSRANLTGSPPSRRASTNSAAEKAQSAIHSTRNRTCRSTGTRQILAAELLGA